MAEIKEEGQQSEAAEQTEEVERRRLNCRGRKTREETVGEEIEKKKKEEAMSKVLYYEPESICI